MRNKRKKSIIIGSLIAIVCMMAIGYSAFLTQLDIKGTTNISSEWSIRIISAEVYNTNGDAENVKNTFTDLTANLEANLYNKGDYIDYRIIVENNGDFDAKLDTLGITNSNNEAVKITSSGFTKGQTLYKNTTETLTVRIAYNNDYNGDDPTGTSGESNITLGFVQNEGGTIVPTVDHLVTYDYVTNGGESTTAENEYLAEGSSINLSYTASKANYEFLGWSQSPTSTTPLESLTMGTEDIVLYAIFKIIDNTPPTITNLSYTSTSSTITVAVTASDDETEITKYEYSIDDGEYVEGTGSNYTFTRLTENTGYKIKVRVTNEAGLQAEDSIVGKSTSDLTSLAVTSGDGLYADSVESGRYIYRGSNPNNYITFNGESAGWRIISVESDGTIKIMKISSLGDMAWDTEDSRSATYCNEARYGCNSWGSSSTMLNSSGTAVTSMPREYGGTAYALPTVDSTLNQYLNGTYYNSLTSTAQSKIVSHSFNVGVLAHNSGQTIATDVTQESTYKWTGKIALANVTDYVRASTDSNCISLDTYRNSTCYNNSSSYNWMFNSTDWWTLSPYSNATTFTSWYVRALGNITNYAVYGTKGVRPVVFLSSDITLSGSGTESDSYTIGEGGAKTKALEKPTFSGDSNTITITYPEGCGSTLTCSYIKDSGEEVPVTTSTVDVTFTNNGTLAAKVNDGTNYVSSSYTFQVTAAMLVYDNTKTGIDCDNVQCAVDAIKRELG